MAPTKSSSQSILLSGYTTTRSGVELGKRKCRRTKPSPLFRKRRDGLLNTAVSVRSELMNIAKRNSIKSPLLRLPGEIRNKIWAYTVGYHQIDIGHRSHKRTWPIGPTVNVRPLNAAVYFPRTFICPSFAVSRVCRQMYIEISPYIYTLNTFGFDSYITFDRWIRHRPIGQKRLVASINMPYDYTHLYHDGFRKSFREKFPNIKRIGIDDHVAIFSRTPQETDVEVAKQRIVHFVRDKEGADVRVEWYYGLGGRLMYY